MPLRFDIDESRRTALGLIVLQADETIEPEFRELTARSGGALYHSRIPSDLDVTPQSLARMETAIPDAVSLLPTHLDFDVIGYGCTSGATVIGPAAVARAVRSVKPTVAVTAR